MDNLNGRAAARRVGLAAGLAWTLAWALAWALTLGAGMASGTAAAQATQGTQGTTSPPKEFVPSVGQPGKDVIWVPSPDRVVNRLLRMAEVKPTDLVIDLGSGDGKIAIAAAKDFGARARGLEYNPDMVTLSRQRAQQAGVANRVEFRQADIFASDFTDANVITMYLLPTLNLRLRPILMKMKPGTRLASHSFDMGSWQPDETSIVGAARTFLWIVPANAAGDWRLANPAAGLPQNLSLRQRYQKVQGEAAFGEIDASLEHVDLRGDVLRFSVRDAEGRIHNVAARVEGDRMIGSFALPGQNPVNFEARRSTSPQSIEEPAS